ncbi:hypothetical protein JOQ06_015953, partial [Pogonophryne albipinna]
MLFRLRYPGFKKTTSWRNRSCEVQPDWNPEDPDFHVAFEIMTDYDLTCLCQELIKTVSLWIYNGAVPEDALFPFGPFFVEIAGAVVDACVFGLHILSGVLEEQQSHK